MRQLVAQDVDVQAVELDAQALPVDGVEPTGRADIVVDLGSSDYDARAAQRESTTWFTAASLAAADASGAEHVVFVSSAMVYGAFANNPVPLTEEAVLRPDV
jgi:nucleoside-diphosphate-sugar epimerase